MGGEILSPATRRGYNRAMPGLFVRVALLAVALVVPTAAPAQTYYTYHKRAYHKRIRRQVEPAPPPVSVDKRDSVVAVAGPFHGQPYWLALAQCGGIYFRLNILYTDAAVRARVVKPDPKANALFTKKLNEAIKVATTYFDGAERVLMNDRGIERADAVLTYDGQSRAAGERLKTIDAALAAAKGCPVLYQACRHAHPKQCGEPLAPMG